MAHVADRTIKVAQDFGFEIIAFSLGEISVHQSVHLPSLGVEIPLGDAIDPYR
jgi:hypothetical protein